MPRTTRTAAYTTRHVDAGHYCLTIQSRPDGGIGVQIVHVSPSRGISAVAYLDGAADALPGERLLRAGDAYDSTNTLDIAAGGGRPSPSQPRSAALLTAGVS